MLDMIVSYPEIEQCRECLKSLIYEGGGSRLTNRLAIRAKELGMDLCAGWGLTEVYIKVGLQYLKPHMFSWSEDKKIDFLSRTGMAPPFVEQRVVDEQGRDVAKDGETARLCSELREHMTQYVEDGKILKWWIPERFIFVDEIPRTSLGKFDKKTMRSRYWCVLGE